MQRRASPAKVLLFVLLVGGIVTYWYWRSSYGTIGQVGRLDFDTAGHIAFLRREQGKVDLYVVNADGGEPRRFTTDGRPKSAVAWSPDGKQLCLSVELRDVASTAYQLFLLGAGDPRQATYGSVSKGSPAWSPDGKNIAFLAGGSIRVMSPNASESRQVYPPPHKSAAQEQSGGGHDQPGGHADDDDSGFRKAPVTRFRWSPNSLAIAGRQETEGEYAHARGESDWWLKKRSERDPVEITVMTAESTVILPSIEESEVVQIPGGDRVSFDWFPDSRRLALAISGPGDAHGLLVVRVDERGLPPSPIVLTSNGAYSFMNPTVSPDGSQVAFELWKESRQGDREMLGVAALPTAPSSPVVLAGPPDLARVRWIVKGDAHDPSWSPDGARVAYWTNRGTGRDCYVVRLGGGEPVCLTGKIGDNFGAVWAPRAK